MHDSCEDYLLRKIQIIEANEMVEQTCSSLSDQKWSAILVESFDPPAE